MRKRDTPITVELVIDVASDIDDFRSHVGLSKYFTAMGNMYGLDLDPKK